jgi:histidyl-tRNA synthetase
MRKRQLAPQAAILAVSPHMQTLPGFREFYPDDCARRNYVLETWRTVARRYGFVEYDSAVVEPLALYEKKSGGELVGQMFTVGAMTEPGEVKGALRPEMTPSLARMVAARERDFKKPLKWFSVPNCFRHERQQRGRLREFYQLNVDIIGEASSAADAELLAVCIDTLRGFGFSEKDIVIRISSRSAWQQFFANAGGRPEDEYEFFQIVDKAERTPPEKTSAALAKFALPSLTTDSVLAFMRSKEPTPDLAPIVNDLNARGLGGYIEVDYAIVRGLAYYTGVVFEVFDREKSERALAGGGRYDGLLALMSDGKVNLPALGFGMGDVVLANMIADIPAASAKMEEWRRNQHACDVYVVVAKEEKRPDALRIVQELREAGLRVDFAMTAAKVGKQFQAAEHLGARTAVLIGDEWPQIKVKTLATREEVLVDREQLIESLRQSISPVV